ncbi:iron chaperone [Micropruina sp.]|uniref:iron chaperone n=1 Tax=Micropruina sp. TaxID=2737536 RepID=UPI0039E60013
MSRSGNDGAGLSAEEQAALKETVAERRRTQQRGGNKKAGELQDCLDKIAALPDPDRVIAERIHRIVTEAAPELDPKTWYGMPAYSRDGKVLCFFQPASKFNARYATFGFNDGANIDEGTMWPASWAIMALTDDDVAKLTELVRRAVS